VLAAVLAAVLFTVGKDAVKEDDDEDAPAAHLG
jgi:hypothetical protein